MNRVCIAFLELMRCSFILLFGTFCYPLPVFGCFVFAGVFCFADIGLSKGAVYSLDRLPEGYALLDRPRKTNPDMVSP